jgi:hypothetical protein
VQPGGIAKRNDHFFTIPEFLDAIDAQPRR